MGYALELITPPGETLLTLAEVKAQCRVDGTDEDALLAMFMAAAENHVSGRDAVTGRAMVTQVWELRIECFPRSRYIRLPLPPLQSIDSVKYTDVDGVSQTMPSTDYRLHQQYGLGFVELAAGKEWPGDLIDEQEAVQIRFTCGYGAASAVPSAVKAAALLIAGSLYRNREADITGTIVAENPALSMLLQPYMVDHFGVDP